MPQLPLCLMSCKFAPRSWEKRLASCSGLAPVTYVSINPCKTIQLRLLWPNLLAREIGTPTGWLRLSKQVTREVASLARLGSCCISVHYCSGHLLQPRPCTLKHQLVHGGSGRHHQPDKPPHRSGQQTAKRPTITQARSCTALRSVQ